MIRKSYSLGTGTGPVELRIISGALSKIEPIGTSFSKEVHTFPMLYDPV